jgi:hypothetical protein
MAEGVGFEPTVGKPTPVFKTGTFGRSVTPPLVILDEMTKGPFLRALFTSTCARSLVENYFAKSY